MALSRIERTSLDWPIGTEFFRRFFDGDGTRSGWLRVEEFRDGDEIVLRAEIPGIDPAKDVEVTVTDGALRISAHREEKSEATEKAGYRSEFRYGSFTRDFGLPEGVKAEEVKASYTNGILEVRVPVPAASKHDGSVKVPVATS